MDGCGKVAGSKSLAHGEGELRERLTRPGSHERRTNDTPSAIDCQPGEPVDISIGYGTVDITVVAGDLPEPVCQVSRLGRCSDRSDLWVGEGDSWHGPQIHPAAKAQHGIACGQAAVYSRGVGELRVAGEVPRRPDALVRGAQHRIHDHEAVIVENYPGRLEPHVPGVGCTTHGHEQLVERDVRGLFPVGDH